MTDRELLELAAKAAGLTHLTHWSDCINDWDSPHRGGAGLHPGYYGGKASSWNPLTDDGDALRLAVKLRLRIEPNCIDRRVVVEQTVEWWGSDEGSATRRAIVRAAAAIGEGME